MIQQVTAFDLDGDRPTPISPDMLILPEQLTHMICRNLRWFLGVECITTDYRVSADRVIDAIAIDDHKLPLVVKFRRRPGENIVESAQSNLEWLIEHPESVDRAVRKFTTLDANQVRSEWIEEAVCIAAGFSAKEIELARESNMWGEPVQLIQVLRSDDGHVVILRLDTSPELSEEVGRNLQSLENSEALASSTGIPEGELRRWVSDEIRATLQAEFNEQLQRFNLSPTDQHKDFAPASANDPFANVTSDSRQALEILNSLPHDTPRSTQFLHVLQASLGPTDTKFYSTYPGKSTLRAAYPELGSGCELVYGVRRNDARVEWYIPRHFPNRDLIRALEDHWDRTANSDDTYQWVEDAFAVRILRFSSLGIGWNDLESLWPAVLDDLNDLMGILEMSIEDFFLEACGYNPLSP